MVRLHAVGLIVFALAGVAATRADQPVQADQVDPAYSLVDLGNFGPAALNRSHQLAIGQQLVPSWLPSGSVLAPRAFAGVWQKGRIRPLSDSRLFDAAAAGINDRGEVVGYAAGARCPTCPTTMRARLWRADGTVEWLGDLPASLTNPPATGSEARAINSAGDIVGWVVRDTARGVSQRAARWRDGAAELLGPDLAGRSSAAFAINDLGEVAGWAEFDTAADGRTAEHAAFWPAGTSTTAIDLGPGNAADVRSVAHAINNAKQIVGTSYGADGNRRAVLWADGAAASLAALTGDADSEAFGINARGEIVGTSYNHRCGTCTAKAVIWNGKTVIDLNALLPADSGWKLFEASAIDADGCIIGRGTLRGEPRYFMLLPE